jgi:hypothetical protein
MPSYLYALIALFVFAIVHGIHFSIEPVLGPASYYNVRVSPTDPTGNSSARGLILTDLQRAGL